MPQLSTKKHAVRNVVRACCETAWMLEEEKLAAITELLSLRNSGLEFSPDEVRSRISMASRVRAFSDNDGDEDDEDGGPIMRGPVCIIPLQGILAPKMNLLQQISGGTSTQEFAQWFQEAMDDDDVAAIVLDVDSPGGSATGNAEVAEMIRANRGKKPVTAVATGTMASAAYYIASAADEIVASPSSSLGSIGTYMIHGESSRADQNAGMTYTVIKSGTNKAVGNDVEPLNSSGRAVLQEKVDDLQTQFDANVAANRGVSAEAVKQNFGQGKTMLAPRAVAAGLADRIGTLEAVVAEKQALQLDGTRKNPKPGSPLDVAIFTKAGATKPKTQTTPPSLTRNPTMTPEIKAMLVAKGLIAADATDTQAQVALMKFYAARNSLVPTDAAQIAADLAAYSPSAASVQALRAEAATQERARIQDIQARAELLGIGQLEGGEALVQAAIDAGHSIEQALTTFTDAMAKHKGPVGRIETGRAADDKFFIGAVDAMWHRSGSPLALKEKPKPEGADLRYKSLLQICQITLERNGQRVIGDPDDIAAAALRGNGDMIVIRQSDGSTDSGFGRVADFPNILSALAGKMLDLPPEYFPSTYREWAYQIPSVPDFKPKTILAAGEFGEFPRVDDGDDFTSSIIGEEASWIATDSYGDEFALTPRMVVDDNLGVFEEAIRDKQVAHDLTINRLCIDLLTGNAYAGDGYQLYDNTNHANDIASGAAPNQTQLSTMRQDLRLQSGVSKKRKLNLTLKGLLIPVELETTTQQLLSTNVRVIPTATTSGEIFRGQVDYWVDPMLSDNSATIYYGFADKRIVRPIIYCHQVGFESMKSRLYFNPKNNSRVFQAEGRMAAAVRNWRGTVRNNGA